MIENDEHAMRLALERARYAMQNEEIPVGAIVVSEAGEVIGQGDNRTITDADPSAHAEIVALRAAGQYAANYRLPGSTLYVTLEPCLMCVGAILHARLRRVVFGASDPKTGACGGALSAHEYRHLNHQTQFEGGLLAHECGALLQEFFKMRRGQKTPESSILGMPRLR